VLDVRRPNVSYSFVVRFRRPSIAATLRPSASYIDRVVVGETLSAPRMVDRRNDLSSYSKRTRLPSGRTVSMRQSDSS